MNTLSEFAELRAAEMAFGSAYPEPLDFELAFTALHQATEGLDPARREARLLGFLFPALLQPIEPDDLFAGRIQYPLAGFSPEPLGLGYYCREDSIERLIAAGVVCAGRIPAVRSMLDYWRTRTTQARVRAAFPPAVAAELPSDLWPVDPGVGFPLYRLAGTMLDYALLLRKGLPGMRDHVRAAAKDGPLTEGFLAALAVLERSFLFYAAQAEALAADEPDAERAAEQGEIASRLRALCERAPRTFDEAIQLFWLYALHSGTWNYGRLDVILGPFLEADLRAGRTTEAEALARLCSLWRLMKGYANQYNNRVIIGGMDRPDEAAADRFALLAIEATRLVRLNEPQLTLRFHRGQNPLLYRRALDALGEGCTFPLLYNDDVNVPAVARAYGIPADEAVHYLPYGCGEYMFEHRSLSAPNGLINMAAALREVLLAPADPDAAYPSFDALWAAYDARLARSVAALARHQRIEYDVAGATAPWLFLSLLTDDCVARGRGLCSGGVRRLEGTLETYGNTNTADCFTALRRFVYDENRYTLREIAEACRTDFQDRETLRQELLVAPKYGNDDPEADATAIRVHAHICRLVAAEAAPARLDSYKAVLINNGANTVLGLVTGATPDGRRAGEALANANNPAPGRDRRGVTAFLNSLVKLDPSLHGGAVQNMKFSKGLFTRDRAKLEALLAAYWELGGAQAMITVVSRRDLEEAMREPEKWGHLMVRVGGFSIRFIELPRPIQLEVLNRTLHE